MGIEVHKQFTHATTWLKLASIAGVAITGGGMRTSIAGAQNATGATRITNTIAALEYDDRPAETHSMHLVLTLHRSRTSDDAWGAAGSRFAWGRARHFDLSITS